MLQEKLSGRHVDTAALTWATNMLPRFERASETRVPYFGVLIIRILYYLEYYFRVPYFRKLPFERASSVPGFRVQGSFETSRFGGV